MLCSSLLKTFFTGDIVVFRNSPAPMFLVERKGLEEVYFETPAMHSQEGAEEAWCWKYRVAELIEHPEQYERLPLSIPLFTRRTGGFLPPQRPS